MSSYARIAAVTGANRGIGFAIVRQLALKYPTSYLANGPFLIYLTARDRQKGEEAVKRLHDDSDLRAAKVLQRDGGLADIKYLELDVTSEESRRKMTDFLAQQHPEGIDALVNNAGIAIDGFDAEKAEKTLSLNYFATVGLTENMVPSSGPARMKKGGRIVNMGSAVGKLGKYSTELQDRFRSAKDTAQITRLMEEFQTGVANGTHSQAGWPTSSYAVSKSGIAGFTRTFAETSRVKELGLLVNSCCPGWVVTDMTKGRGRKTPDQGAQTPVKLALEDIGGTNGEFWEHEEISSW